MELLWYKSFISVKETFMKKKIFFFIGIGASFLLDAQVFLTRNKTMLMILPEESKVLFPHTHVAFSPEIIDIMLQYAEYAHTTLKEYPLYEHVERIAACDFITQNEKICQVIHLALLSGLPVVAHGLARQYIKQNNILENTLFFSQQAIVAREVGDVIRKQFFLLTKDESVLVGETPLTLALSEVLVSVAKPIFNNRLDLSGLHLSSLDGISLFNIPQLEHLDLSHNCLKDLPDELTSFVHLTTLDVSYNNLTHLPSNLGALAHLKRFDATHNILNVLPTSLGALSALWRLDVSHNQLKTLPHEIGLLTNLVWLIANDNLLVELPESIGNLENLQKLLLDNNNLELLPPSMRHLLKLYQLSCKNNPLLKDLSGLPESLQIMHR